MKISIPKDIISSLPQVEFFGKIFVIDSIAKANMAIASLNEEKLVGFDTETRPAFVKGKINDVALIQISTANECYLFRINKIGFPDILKEFIENETIIKVGLSLNNDFTSLRRKTNITPRGFIDIQNLAINYHISDMSLQRIYAILFNKRISKGQRLSNWEAQTLTPAQQQYAAIDAIACLEIYNYLSCGFFNPEESEYIIEELTLEIDKENEK